MKRLAIPLCALLLSAPAFCDSGKQGVAQKLINEGIAYAGKGDYSSALKNFNRAASITPENSKIFFNRAIIYRKMGEQDKSRADFKKSCEMGNLEGCKISDQLAQLESAKYSEVSAMVRAAAELDSKGQSEAALRKLDEAAAKAPDYADTYYMRAHIYFNGKHDSAAALPAVNKALSLRSNYSDAYFLRASIYRADKQLDKAIADFSRAAEYSSQDAQIYAERGDLYLLTRKYDKAESDFKKALSLNVDYDRAHYGLGMACKERNDYEQALKHLDRACALKNQGACFAADEVRASMAKRNREDISGLLKEAAKSEGKGKFADALSFMDKAIARAPDSHEAYMAKGNLYLNSLKDDGKAAENYSVAIRLRSSSAEARLQRGIAYKNMGQLDKAMEDLAASAKIESSNYKTYSAMGAVESRKGDYAAAAGQFRTAAALKPDDGELFFQLANAYRNKGDKTEALANFEKSCKLGFDAACAWQKSMQKTPDKKQK